MMKNPIAVNMATSEQKLDSMSRINFGKVYIVEWNVKVMNVGMMSPDSIADFMMYSRPENR
jgi:hypothetical protein